MQQTIYRPVPGYTDLYAGMDGTIIHGGKGRELKQTNCSNGYLQVHIPNYRQVLVHRLVAAAFLGPCPSGMQVRHADNTRNNNHISNLCYGTPRDNTQDAMREGTHQGALMSAKTKCSRGHPYSAENTYVHPSTGSRHCRTCSKAYLKEYFSRPEYKAHRRKLWRRRQNKGDKS